jgi:hypothetical protein
MNQFTPLTPQIPFLYWLLTNKADTRFRRLIAGRVLPNPICGTPLCTINTIRMYRPKSGGFERLNGNYLTVIHGDTTATVIEGKTSTGPD